MSRRHQGKRNNATNGEEPGKIHHEYPGVEFRAPYVSTYNACDTTALYLIAIEALLQLDKKAATEFIQTEHASIEAAIGYLQRHIRDDLFWEYPPAPAKHFSLRTTYWKDSIVPRASHGEEPRYPVGFALVQFQTARALQSAAQFLARPELRDQARRMFEVGIRTYIQKDNFCVEQDETGRLEQSSSDELHALAYIPREYGSMLPLAAMSKRAHVLMTPAGFVCTPKIENAGLSDHYHGYVVWVFEQAFIHYGCRKFGLDHAATIAERCAPYIENGQELLGVESTVQGFGNGHQLWSVAAGIYFSDAPSLRQRDWL